MALRVGAELGGAAHDPDPGPPLQAVDPDDFWEWFDAPIEASEAPRPRPRLEAPLTRAGRWRGGLAWAGLVGAFLTLALLVLPPLAGMQVLTVYSGSMAPTIKTGDAVVIRPVLSADLRVGDVVTYRPADDPSKLITHRIDSIRYEVTASGGYGDYILTTKGDANASLDAPWRASPKDVFGRVVVTLPKLGYVRSFFSSGRGKIVALVAFAVFLAAGSVSRRHARRVVEAVEAAQP